VAEADEWRLVTRGPFRIKVFSGGHFYLAQNAPAVNDEIAADIEQLMSYPVRT
jgi:surfactin synthase thioesterase subunit